MYITPRQKKRYIANAVFFLIAIPLTALAAYGVTQIVSDASAEAIPQDVSLSNLTTNSITVTWVTSVEAEAEIVVSGADEEVFQDFRGAGERMTHYVEIVDLTPGTDYEFSIISNDDEYTSEGGNAFKFKTSTLTDQTPVPNPVFGSVPELDDDDALIYFFSTSPASLPLTTVPTNTGNWILDLSSLRGLDGSTIVNLTDTSAITILVVGKNGDGSSYNGTLGDAFDDSGKSQVDDELFLTENNNVFTELPEQAKLGDLEDPPDDPPDTPDPVACNGACSAELPCVSGLSCINGLCRNTTCDQETDCECPEEEEDPALCNESCDADTPCESGLQCISGSCRNSQCSTEADCTCPTGFDPSKRQFVVKLDVPWIDMFSSGTPPIQGGGDDEDPNIVTGKESIKVVNQSDNGFGVVWMSSTEQEGYVMVGEEPDDLTSEVNDVRDGVVERNKYHSHLVEVNGLDPDTTYYYVIVAGGELITNGEEPFKIDTFATLSTPPPFKTVEGSVDGAEDVEDVVVLLQLSDQDEEGSSGNSTYSASVLDVNGGWIASIGDLRTTDGEEYYVSNGSDLITAQLYVYAQSSPSSTTVDSVTDDIFELQVMDLYELDRREGLVALGLQNFMKISQ